MSFPIQTLVVNPVGEEKHTVGPLDAQVRLVNTDGTDFSAGSRAYELQAAGEDTLGAVKRFAPEQTLGNVDDNIAKQPQLLRPRTNTTNSSRPSTHWRNSSTTLSPASRPLE